MYNRRNLASGSQKKKYIGAKSKVRTFRIKLISITCFNVSMLMKYETVFSYGIIYLVTPQWVKKETKLCDPVIKDNTVCDVLMGEEGREI